jgi:hypothetical protein
MYYETKAAMKFNPWLCVFPLGCMTTHDMLQNVQQQPMILTSHAATECDIAHATKGEISAWDP